MNNVQILGQVDIDNSGSIGVMSDMTISNSITGLGTTIVSGDGVTLNITSITQNALIIGSSSFAAVPEPSAIAILLTATLGGLLWWRR